MSSDLNDSSIEIREVWDHNLENEIEQIEENVDKFRLIGMDTEFPGAPAEPVLLYARKSDEKYAKMQLNVNCCKLIQLGLCFMDEQGNLPTCGTDKQIIWQFNFKGFDPDIVPCMDDSVALLRSTGINFERYNEFGVDSQRFGELIMSSGVLNHDNIQWVTFAGAYDFGYLLKLLTHKPLPETQEEFLQLVSVFFPQFYDVKHMIMSTYRPYGSLDNLAMDLGVKRIGVSHNSASDSLLTLGVFKEVKQKLLRPELLEATKGFIYELTLDDVYQTRQ